MEFSHLNLISNFAQKTIDTNNLYKQELSLGRRTKNYINKILKRTPGTPNQKIFWTNSILLEGLLESYSTLKDEKLLASVTNYCDKLIKSKKIHPRFSDEAMFANVLMSIQDHSARPEYTSKIDEFAAHLLEKHKKTCTGAIPYREREHEIVYVDTIGITLPFLAKYGEAHSSKEATDLVSSMIIDYYKYGFDPDSGLPYHAYDCKSLCKKGLLGWGRGTGWFLYGTSKALPHLPDGQRKTDIADKTNELLKSVLRYQREDGSFAWDLKLKNAPADTSATAMIGYALVRLGANSIFRDEYLSSSSKAYAFIKSATDSKGTVLKCSGECLGIGVHPDKFGYYPWGQGPAIAFSAAINR